MHLIRRTLLCVSTLALVATTLVVGAGPAAAGHVTCGQVITVSTTFDGNVGPCSTGLVIAADNITIDLGTYTLSGTTALGEGPGILVDGRTGVTVRNGTVTGFDSGVAIDGGSGNTLTQLRLSDNRGTGDYGEGALVLASTGNTVSNNVIRNNGPYGGISLLRASHNLVERNQIIGNNMSTTNTSGIRLENAGNAASNSNTVRNNVVSGSGLDGIQVFSRGSDNVISRNVVTGNNRDGINVFAGGNRNTIEDNQVRNNGFGPIPGSGIFVRGAAGSQPAPANNIIRRNGTSGNAQFDLRDGTTNCGTNVWTANQGVTGTPPCVLNP